MDAVTIPCELAMLFTGRLSTDPRRSDPRPKGGLPAILHDTAVDHGLQPADLLSLRRFPKLVRARQDFMWRARSYRWSDGRYRYSNIKIADFLGLEDHTTILHGAKRHEDRLDAAMAVAAE